MSTPNNESSVSLNLSALYTINKVVHYMNKYSETYSCEYIDFEQKTERVAVVVGTEHISTRFSLPGIQPGHGRFGASPGVVAEAAALCRGWSGFDTMGLGVTLTAWHENRDITAQVHANDAPRVSVGTTQEDDEAVRRGLMGLIAATPNEPTVFSSLNDKAGRAAVDLHMSFPDLSWVEMKTTEAGARVMSTSAVGDVWTYIASRIMA